MLGNVLRAPSWSPVGSPAVDRGSVFADLRSVECNPGNLCRVRGVKGKRARPDGYKGRGPGLELLQRAPVVGQEALS